jgi:hypothetical protein
MCGEGALEPCEGALPVTYRGARDGGPEPVHVVCAGLGFDRGDLLGGTRGVARECQGSRQMRAPPGGNSAMTTGTWPDQCCRPLKRLSAASN